MIDVAVYDRLKSLAQGRVYFVRAQQSAALPLIVYTIISSQEEYSGDGHDGLSQYRVQIDVWARDRAAGRALMGAVKTIMRVSAADFSTVDETDNIDEIDSQTDEYRASTDFICWLHS